VLSLAAIPPPPFQGLPLGPLDLRMYGLLIAIGAYLALLLTVRRYTHLGGDPDVAEKAALLGLVGGFLGARIGYVIPRFLGPGGFVERPGDILAIWQGGLAFFGGLTGGTIAVVLYVRWKGGDLPAMADAMAPALPLAQAIGRWGNYFNQELFGRPTDLPWALRVDPEIAERAGHPADTTFHPTFLYESLWNALLVLVILGIERAGWLRRRGSLVFVYLIGYGVGRGWIEALRIDTIERYLGLSRNNWIAIAVTIICLVGLVVWERRPAPSTRDGGTPPGDDDGGPLPAAEQQPVEHDDPAATAADGDVDAPAEVDPHTGMDPDAEVDARAEVDGDAERDGHTEGR
jgi:prolipoprotein diacylglyceryl transferase